MRCPKCGGETDEKKNYCSHCGAELRPRDNSSDETLRLPDLSGVPLDHVETRRRESAVESRRRKEDRALKITFIVCGLAVVVVLGALFALLLTGREKARVPMPFDEDVVDNTPSEDYDDYDYDEPDISVREPEEGSEEPEDEPAEEPEEEPGEEPEEGPGEEKTPDDGEDTEPEEGETPLVIAEPDIRDEE